MVIRMLIMHAEITMRGSWLYNREMIASSDALALALTDNQPIRTWP